MTELSGSSTLEPEPGDGSRFQGGDASAPDDVKLTMFEDLPGAPAGKLYGYASGNLPLPPGGLAYVIELTGAPADAEEPSGAAASEPSDDLSGLRIVGYVDRYSRAFSVDGMLPMPPAQQAELQLLRYADRDDGAGCVELPSPQPDGEPWRVAEFVARDDGATSAVTFTDARIELGESTRGRALPLAHAVSLAFLAFVYLPRQRGERLSALGVADMLDHLRSETLFDAIDHMVGDVDAALAQPLVSPPGLLIYVARALRAAGAVGLTAASLAPQTSPAAGLPDVTGLTWASGGSLTTSPLLPGLFVARMDSPEPQVNLVRTSEYANLFYVAFNRAQVSDDGARALLEIEGILNRALFMASRLDGVGAVTAATAQQCAELDRWIIEDILAQGITLVNDAGASVAAPERVDASTELDVRLAFARACESLRVPYRLDYRFRYDAARGALSVDVDAPDAAIMPREFWDDAAGSWAERSADERAADVTRYAFHLVILVACAAFACSDRVQRVIINAWGGPFGAGEDGACLLSAGFNRVPFLATLRGDAVAGAPEPAGQLAPGGAAEPADQPSSPDTAEPTAAGMPAPAVAAEPAGPSDAQPPVRSLAEADPSTFVHKFAHAYRLGEHAELLPVRPLASLDDEAALPPHAADNIETDERPFSEKAARLLHAQRICDMGIYEDAPRGSLAETALAAFEHDDLSDVLAVIRDMHDRTENIPVREACLRVSEGIASGAITADSGDTLKEMFSDVYGLKAGLRAATRRAARNPMDAVAAVESLALQVDERGWFADTPTRVYRYFDCYASRTLYATHCADSLDGGRDLRLCADEHFLIHHRLASLLSDSIEHAEEAIAHGRRCVEIAPSVAASYLRLARCYFCVFDYESEINVLNRMLTIAWNPNDVGMALYWLGYAYWMTDRKRLGLACYQRSVAFDRNLAEPCSAEVTEFLRKDGMRHELISDDEARELFRQGGVPLGQVQLNAEALVRAAGHAADAGSFRLAQNLLGSASVILRDDALAPVLDSYGSGTD